MQLPQNKANQKLLSFPKHSLGRVYIDDVSVGERYLGEACGAVLVPVKALVKLHISDQAVERLSELSRLEPNDIETLSVAGTPITDEQLFPVRCLTGLQVFECQHTSVTGSVFEHWTCFTKLKKINAWWSLIRDGNIRHLANFPALDSVDFSRTPLTDAGAEALARLNLKTIRLADARVSEKYRHVHVPSDAAMPIAHKS